MVRSRKVARRPLGEEPILHGDGADRSSGDAEVDDAPLEPDRLETQPDQRHQLRDVECRRSGTDHLGPDPARQVEPEVQRQLGQHLAPFGSSREQTIEQTLDGKQQTGDVGLRLIEIVPREQRLRRTNGLQRRIEITRGAPVQAVRVTSEAAADAFGRQLEKTR